MSVELTQEVEAYVSLCVAHSKSGTDLKNRQQLYAKTFEWYVSEVFRREFGARAAGFGIRLADAHPEDDFDCLAILDSGVMYVECKTGGDQVYGGVKRFIRRDREINAYYSLYIFDRGYAFQKRNSGTDDMPRLDSDQAARYSTRGLARITTLAGDCTYFRFQGDGGRSFLACTASGNLEKKIRHAIRWSNLEHESGIIYHPELYNYENIAFPAPESFPSPDGA
ncbi:hypothetical protein GCM10027184_64870 [Saccharothrix stipae]